MATRTPQDHKHSIDNFKALIQFVCVERDEKGEVIREIPTEPQPLYKREFDQFPTLATETLAVVRQQLAAQQNGRPE